MSGYLLWSNGCWAAAGPAFRAAVQRVDGGLDLVPGLQALGGEAVAHQHAGRATFEDPVLGDAVGALDRYGQKGVRADELELLHRAADLDRVRGVEHGKRV